MIEHWNGRAWRFVSGIAYPPYPGGSLTAVSCPSPRTCVAVGEDYGTARAMVYSRKAGGPWRYAEPPYFQLGGEIYPHPQAISCLGYNTCAVVGDAYDRADDWPLIAWRGRQTGHFVAGYAPHFFVDVSCRAGTCTYVGRAGADDMSGQQPGPWRPVIYRGTGLHPTEQTIPAPPA